jgi:transcriptional pleiotropic regulator of transition state genes
LLKDILDRFQLKDGDMIDISYNDTQIIIEPHRQTYVCDYRKDFNRGRKNW